MNDQRGFVLLVPLIIAVVAIGVSSTIVYQANRAERQEAQLREQTKQIEDDLNTVVDAREKVQEEESIDQPDQPSPTPPAPTSEPAPAPETDLYNSPLDSFATCPGTVTAYVVNKSGAALYKNYGDAYRQTNPVKNVPYKTALQKAGCQDGDAVMVSHGAGTEYVVHPKDIRKTRP